MFNLDPGEITVIVLLAIIFLGPAKLPELARGVRDFVPPADRTTSRWSRTDWIRVLAALVAGALALALLTAPRH